MIENGEAGICCDNCGHEVLVKYEQAADELKTELAWSDNGDPICPDCGHDTTFHHYLEPEYLEIPSFLRSGTD